MKEKILVNSANFSSSTGSFENHLVLVDPTCSSELYRALSGIIRFYVGQRDNSYRGRGVIATRALSSCLLDHILALLFSQISSSRTCIVYTFHKTTTMPKKTEADKKAGKPDTKKEKAAKGDKGKKEETKK